MSYQIHRFHDTVAISLGTGETLYVDPYTARTIAAAIKDAADDVDAVKFTDSVLGTVSGQEP